MQHTISISVINNSVGIPPSEDGIMGIFVEAVAISTFALNTPYLLTSITDANNLGINAAYDVTNGTAVFQQINDFYNEAGSGALLWLIGVPTGTSYATYVAGTTFDAMIKATGAADPTEIVKIIGLCYAPPTALQTASDFPADVAATITALQTKQQALFKLGYQFSCIVDGYNMSSTVTPSTIGTQATNSAFSVSLCITGTLPNGVSGVGAALGKFSRISVGHNLGRVKDGPVFTPVAYLTNSIAVQAGTSIVVGNVYTVMGASTDTVTYNSVTYTFGQSFTAVVGHTSFTATGTGYLVDNLTPVAGISVNNQILIQGLSDTSIQQLGLKQFMFHRTWFGKSGLFWNDAATCTSSTLQLSSQEYNRCANKLAANALSFFINEIGDQQPLDTTTGSIAQGALNTLQTEFDTTYIDPLSVNTGTGDITSGNIILSGPNFNSTRTMNFTLNIVPAPGLGGVAGTIQFTATLPS
jgi:hypothetical protein